MRAWVSLQVLMTASAAMWAAAGPEFRAGTAASTRVRALALEDRQGGRVALAEVNFSVTLALSEAVAARLMRSYGLQRGDILIRGGAVAVGPAEFAPAAAELKAALGRALDGMEPARLFIGPDGLSVTDSAGRCRATLSAGGTIAESGCAPGKALRGRIRGVFRMAEPFRELARRGDAAPAFPVQAIGIGGRALILALGGPDVPAEFRCAATVVALRSNDDRPLPEDQEIRETIRLVLRMAGR